METYQGHVRTPQDAIILFEACRLGLLPRVQRRLSEKERQQIQSGSVFVWDEREAGMRRWTDGKSWSASRVSGSFLTYREMEGKRGGPEFQSPTPPVAKPSSGEKSSTSSKNGDSEGEDGPGSGYRYKPDGLMKQSFSITTQDNRHLHLISYYARLQHQPLKQPSTDPQLRNIQPPKGMYPEAAVSEASVIPALVRGTVTPSPYTQPAPQPQVAVAHQYPPPPHYHPGPPMHNTYGPPPNSWPVSPAGSPVGHYAHYPPPPGQYFYAPHHYQSPQYSPYPPQKYGAPLSGPDDRAPSAHLPPPLGTTNAHNYILGGQPSPRASAVPPSYHRDGQPQYSSAPDASHGSFSKPPQHGTQLAPVKLAQNPPSPPASSSDRTPPVRSFAPEPAPIREVPSAGHGATRSPKIIPSINSLINGDSHNGTNMDPANRSGSKSPPNPRLRDIPNAMAAGVLQRDKNDLKRLDSQLLKS